MQNIIINDPIFGFITVPEGIIQEVLAHPYVQRLKHIRQLGLSYLVYPGAVHTRFSHSLGAMHLMKEALDIIQTKGTTVYPSEINATMVAILLHDIGHAPFSHVLEKSLIKDTTHEDISLLMMKQINEDLRKRNESMLFKYGPIDESIAIFQGNYLRPFFHQLISSQLDVDRLDYLSRDSFFCGVTEGNISSSRLLKMIEIKDNKMFVGEKGIYSVEKFLLARRLMFWQVYLHKTSVAAEQMLVNIFHRAKQLAQHGEELFAPPALHFFLHKDITKQNFYVGSEALQQYALLDDNDILCAVKVWMQHRDKVLSTLSQAFIHRHLFKTELLSEPLNDEQKEDLTNKYMLRLGIKREDASYFFAEHIISKNVYSDKTGDSIEILFKDGRIKDIAEESDILHACTLQDLPQKRYLFYYKI